MPALRFREFAWTGLLFEVPEEMRFSRQGGDTRTGHLMLEAETYMIEAKWEPFEPKKAKSLSEVGGSLVEQIKKQSKNQTVTVLGKEDTYVSKHKALYMIVRSRADERVYLWYCVESQRIVILRFVFGAFDDSAKKITKRVLDTLQCHSEKTNIWSLLNLRFETPVSFLLTDTKITVGRAHFLLVDRKLSSFADKTEKILVEYFSMANLIYEQTYRNLDKWFEKNYLKDLSKKLKEGKLKFKALSSTGFRRHKMEVKQGTAKSGTTWRKTTMYTNASWYCPRTNRIYSVTFVSSIKRPAFLKREIDREAHSKLWEDFLSSLKCH